jgi:zinc transport system substrate-binding protein
MIKFLYVFLLGFCLAFLRLTAEMPHVLVSVAPHEFFVKKIAGPTVIVDLLVPAGASSHTFEPTPKQMLSASQAAIWFRIGEGFETRVMKVFQHHNLKMSIVDLRQGLDLIKSQCCHKHEGEDPHFWLSPRLAKIQTTTMYEALVATYPENKDLYTRNLTLFHRELDELDKEITNILKPMNNRTILVSHPAYGYFCRDYNLTQLSIEFEGKDPTPQVLSRVMALAHELNIKTVFIQMQYNNKGAKLVAQDLHAAVVTLNPYSENYIESMREIAHAFANGA